MMMMMMMMISSSITLADPRGWGSPRAYELPRKVNGIIFGHFKKNKVRCRIFNYLLLRFAKFLGC